MSQAHYSPLEEALRDEDTSEAKNLASKYVKAAERKHSEEGQQLLDDMGADAPHNHKPPAVVIMKERTEHTFIAYKFAQGLTVKGVFESLGGEWDKSRNAPVSGTGSFCYQTLINLRQQPWFVSRIHKILEDNGADHVQAALAAELPVAIEVARGILNDDKEKGQTRLNAANFFFDRALGKAQQHIKVEHSKGVEDYEEDAKKLEEELNTIEMEITSINAATTKKDT